MPRSKMHKPRDDATTTAHRADRWRLGPAPDSRGKTQRANRVQQLNSPSPVAAQQVENSLASGPDRLMAYRRVVALARNNDGPAAALGAAIGDGPPRPHQPQQFDDESLFAAVRASVLSLLPTHRHPRSRRLDVIGETLAGSEAKHQHSTQSWDQGGRRPRAWE
jgi:hypothetical protein